MAEEKNICDDGEQLSEVDSLAEAIEEKLIEEKPSPMNKMLKYLIS